MLGTYGQGYDRQVAQSGKFLTIKWFPDAFRNRLVVAIVTLALLVGFPIYLYIGHVYGQQVMRDREQALQSLAESVASTVSVNLGERLREIGLLARMPLQAADVWARPIDAQTLAELQEAHPTYAWIGAADAQGVVRVATGGLLVGQSVSQRPWFSMGQRGPYLGDRHEAKLLQSLLAPPGADPLYFIDVAVPLKAVDGQAPGVLAAHVHWRWAAEVVGTIVPRKSARQQIDVFLVDHRGHISFPDQPQGGDQVPADLRPGPPQLINSWSEGSPYVSVSVAVPEVPGGTPLGWRVVVRQPLHAALAELHALQQVLLLAAAAATLLFLGLAWWGARVISLPLEQLTVQARRIQDGETGVELGARGASAEIRRLSAALKDMAATLIARKNALEENNLHLEHKVAERTAELARSNAALEQLARHDALTGLPNRLASDERLSQEFVRFVRTGRPYSLMVLDVDHFKRVNDTHGHAVGDEVLRQVARVVRASLRASDFIGRTGGEEFLALLPDTSLEAAVAVAHKVRAAAEAHPVAPVGTVTVSVGVSEVQLAHQDADDAVRTADKCLYRAKREGRNRVVSELL